MGNLDESAREELAGKTDNIDNSVALSREDDYSHRGVSDRIIGRMGEIRIPQKLSLTATKVLFA